MKMSLRTISIILVSALLLTGVYLTQAQKPVENAVKGVQVQSEPLNANKILELVNAERAKVGVAPLVSDPRLIVVSQNRANDMVSRDYFGHNDPVTGENLVKAQSYCSYVSENISGGSNKYKEPNTQTVYGWLNSSPHKIAMLDSKYQMTGIAIADDKVVQTFCQQ